MLARLRPRWSSDASLPSAVDSMLARDRRLGSSDRRLYRELIYTAIRYLPWIEPLLAADLPEATRRIAWLASDTDATRAFRSEVAGALPPCPAGVDGKAEILGEDADALTPAWFREECPGAAAPPLRETLLTRAPLWIRMQGGDTASALEEFERRGWPWKRSPLAAGAVMLPADSDVLRTDAYRDGKVEIQDVGSQLVLPTAGVAPGGQWLDACAGAGGKTLQLALMLGAEAAASSPAIRGARRWRSWRSARSGLASPVPSRSARRQILPVATTESSWMRRARARVRGGVRRTFAG